MKEKRLLSIFIWITIGLTSHITAQLALESDISTDPSSSLPNYFYAVDDDIFFSANDGQFGEELWKYDINTEALTRVTDIRPYSLDTRPTSFFHFRNRLFFSSLSNSSYYYDLTTLEVVQVDGGTKDQGSYLVHNNTLYFSARSSSHNTRLYKYDYDNNEAILILDADPDTRNETISNLFIHDDIFYLTVSGVYYTFDVNTLIATELESLPAISAGKFVTYRDKLYCKAQLDEATGRELVEYDPNTDQARLVNDLWNNQGHADPNSMTIINDKLVFIGRVGAKRDIYVYNADTDEVSKVSPLDTESSRSIDPYFIGVVNDRLYFRGNSSDYGIETFILNIETGDINIAFETISGQESDLTYGQYLYQNKVYFGGNLDNLGSEFYSYDITDQSITLIEDINPTTQSSYPTQLTIYNDKIFLSAHSDEFSRTALWSYNPSSGQLDLITDPDSNDPITQSDLLNIINGELYLTKHFTEFGKELARYRVK